MTKVDAGIIRDVLHLSSGSACKREDSSRSVPVPASIFLFQSQRNDELRY